MVWMRRVMVRAQSEDVRDALRGRGLCSGAGACAVRWDFSVEVKHDEPCGVRSAACEPHPLTLFVACSRDGGTRCALLRSGHGIGA